ncbi:MAG: response regulator transcription factor [Anaerolineae bacterium]
MAKILLADDDRDLVAVLRYTLQREGHSVAMAYDGQAALSAIQSETPDLVILDLVMPKKSGIQVLEELPRTRRMPILVLSALGDEENTVRALSAGADDFVSKPFRPRELAARVQALLRRAGKTPSPESNLPLAVGPVRLDPGAREVRLGDKPLQLTRTEFALLHYLMLQANVVISTPELMAAIWGYESDAGDEVVKVTISRLRRKLEPDPANPQHIVNVPGAGYKFQG